MRTAARTASRTSHVARTARTSHRAAAVRADRSGRRPLAALEQRPVRTVAGTHLTRRGRCLSLLVLVALLFAAFSYGRAGSEAATTTVVPTAGVVEATTSRTVQTTVQPGESLWTVATRIAPEADPRVVVQELRRLNDLPTSGLQAGQQLLLPA